MKSIKAVLIKFHSWHQLKFWRTIHIKIDKQIKKAKVNDIERLIELIDQNTFIGFRDTVAVLTMYKTGIRIKALVN